MSKKSTSTTAVRPIEISGPQALRAREVMTKLAISRGTLFNLVKSGRFVKPFHPSPSGKSSRWLLSDVNAYLDRVSQKRSFG